MNHRTHIRALQRLVPATGILISILIASLVLPGCGKSSQERMMEEKLDIEIMGLHEREMQHMAEVQDLIRGIDVELAHHDRLVSQHPKELAGQTADDLVNARKMLLAAKATMTNWMADYKLYDSDMKHDSAMAKLNSDKAQLLKIQAAVESATGAANTALEAHRKLTEQVASTATRREKH